MDVVNSYITNIAVESLKKDNERLKEENEVLKRDIIGFKNRIEQLKKDKSHLKSELAIMEFKLRGTEEYKDEHYI